MSERKLRIYCETSFWSCLNGRPTPLQHIAIKQAATLQWWQEIAPKCEIYISQHVLDESVDGDSSFALMRTESMASAMVLDAFIPDAENLAVELMNGHACPVVITPVDFIERREEFGL